MESLIHRPFRAALLHLLVSFLSDLLPVDLQVGATFLDEGDAELAEGEGVGRRELCVLELPPLEKEGEGGGSKKKVRGLAFPGESIKAAWIKKGQTNAPVCQ
jgi:hypothetical protein